MAGRTEARPGPAMARPAWSAESSRQRVAIENIQPQVDGGRFPIKRIVGDRVTIEADIFADGHDSLAAVLFFREERAQTWQETPMLPLGNDQWRGELRVEHVGRYAYTIQAWVDPFESWMRAMARRMGADQYTAVDLEIGARLIDAAILFAGEPDAARLREAATALRGGDRAVVEAALSEDLRSLMRRHSERRDAVMHEPLLWIDVERERARAGAWYEMFPRSCSPEAGRHGTFADCEARLGYVASMGFDVVYLPPIHPIGRTHRKGRNNAPAAGPEDPGSPWAIGARGGGHMAVHTELGTLEDFRRLVMRATELGLEVALDLACQCSPDHPYVTEHQEWFRRRPDGRVQYAENPPRRYEDIFPFDFETGQWRELWEELKGVVLFWIDQGVRIFRVDNPHTKPFRFWEWLIAEIKAQHPHVVFLSEAFTRPKVMYRLAKLGFSQSYTYFAWRNTEWELEHYFTELTQTPASLRHRLGTPQT